MAHLALRAHRTEYFYSSKEEHSKNKQTAVGTVQAALTVCLTSLRLIYREKVGHNLSQSLIDLILGGRRFFFSRR